jgi:hypothetical protein
LDRYGPRRVQSALLLVAAAGAALFGASQGFLPLVAARAIIGLGVAAALTAGLKAIVLWFPKERVALLNGYMIMLGALGAVTATAPAERLIGWTGWRGLFELLAATTAAAAVVIYLVVPEPVVSQGKSATPAGLKTVYADSRFWRLAPLSATCVGSAWALQSLWAAPWLADVERLGRASLISHLFVMAVALSVGAVLLGSIADRMRCRGAAPQGLLVITATLFIVAQLSLILRVPSSDTPTSPHAQGDDEEVGGLRGRAALARLKNVIGRVESSWAPASTEEGFEIVRRRLFEPLTQREQFTGRDNVARAFADMYRAQHQEFPQECRDSDYEQRLKGAYPIHPEVFDRLYSDWSTLVKFQRTRGVLRLMAAVIPSLWEKGDRNPLIMPANIPIDDPRVRDELTRYLPDQWKPIIEKDIDGPNALPLRIDGEVSNLGKYAATRRVARTLYLGSAPTSSAANRGVEDRRIKLGCAMPGEQPAVFGDALRRLSTSATYLYQDGPRYWYSTQPTVTKMAEDRAEQLARNPDAVAAQIEERLRTDLRTTGEFRRIHIAPPSGADVPDDLETRLVVLGIDHTYSKDPSNKAQAAVAAILQSRGNAPRLFQNSLVFLVVDQTRLQDLDEAIRRYLAWSSILAEKDALNLDPHQVRQAETQQKSADGAVIARLPEAYQWLLVPLQASPQAPVQWQAYRLTGADHLAVRAGKKLRSEDLLAPSFAGTMLRRELDKIPLWRGNHVAIRQLADDFGRYVYLPRLAGPEVLADAARDGVALLSWAHDSFAYADAYDEATGRYRGLRCAQRVDLIHHAGDGLLVMPEVAAKQVEADRAAAGAASTGAGASTTIGQLQSGVGGGAGTATAGAGGAAAPRPNRYYGTVTLDAARVGRDAGKIADEVIAHLSGLIGAKVTVTMEIEVSVPDGVPDNVVRTVTENGRTLKFLNQGFDRE